MLGLYPEPDTYHSEIKKGGKQKMGTSFEYGKTLAGEGAILLILSVVPYVGWVLGIIGVILLMRGVKELSNYYQDNSIYENAFTGVKYYVVAIVAIAVAAAALAIGFSTFGFNFNNFPNIVPAGFTVGIALMLAGLIVAFIFYVLAAMHLRRALNTLAEKTGEHSFATAGTLLWIGAILTIIMVGLLLIFVAWIIAVIGFFSMRSKQQPNGYTMQPTATQAPQAARYCPHCGAPATSDATYCSHCGKHLAT